MITKLFFDRVLSASDSIVVVVLWNTNNWLRIINNIFWLIFSKRKKLKKQCNSIIIKYKRVLARIPFVVAVVYLLSPLTYPECAIFPYIKIIDSSFATVCAISRISRNSSSLVPYFLYHILYAIYPLCYFLCHLLYNYYASLKVE